MRSRYLTLVFTCLTVLGAMAQYSATIIVTDLASGLPVQNATVSLDGNFLSTDAAGEVIFTGLADNTYEYSVTAACYATGLGSITIAGADATASLALEATTTNNVFFFIGSPLAIVGAEVYLTNGNDYFEVFVTTSPFGGDFLENVPFGEFTYTITTPCYETVTGSVTVNCNNGDGIAVFADPAPATSNDVFFFVGSPMAIVGAEVYVTNGNDYFEVFVTSSPFGGDVLANVPYGDYTYTITTPCYETVTGTMTVSCNNGDGIAVFAEPAPATSNDVFFFIGSPMAIVGAEVYVTNGNDYFEVFVTSSPFGGDVLANVPYGDYTYTITTPCYETVTGTMTVSCNNGEGIAVFAEPAPATSNSVFFFIGSPLAIVGSTVELTDGADYNASFVTSSPFGGDVLENVPYGDYTYTITTPCYETVTGTTTVSCNNGDGIAVFAEPVEVVLDLAVSVDGATLSASATGVDYQWVDCGNNNAPISGATGQSYTALLDGAYAVVITSGSCSQTSECVTVITTGVADNEAQVEIMVYPNPFDEVLTVRAHGLSGTVRVDLFATSGQLLFTGTHSAVDLITLSTAQLVPGSYVLQLTDDNARRTVHVVK